MGAIINIPNGSNNIFPLFPTINVNDVDEYYVQALDESSTPLATTTINKLINCDDNIRIHFINSFGCVDGITLHLYSVKHSSTSDLYKRPIQFPVIKSQHKGLRFNIEANDIFVAKTIFYGENEMRWVDELFDSPLAWVENGNELIPIVILNSDREKIKENDPYTYEVTLEYSLSHEKIIIRN